MSAYGTINNISEDIASIRFLVQVSDFHVWYFVYCDHFLTEVVLMKFIYMDVDIFLLRCESVR